MRVCALCGLSLNGRRSDARFCSPGCRREASRLKAILRGGGAGPYSSVAARIDASRKRAKRLCGGADDHESHPR
jgi:hypothetical protein